MKYTPLEYKLIIYCPTHIDIHTLLPDSYTVVEAVGLWQGKTEAITQYHILGDRWHLEAIAGVVVSHLLLAGEYDVLIELAPCGGRVYTKEYVWSTQ